MNKLSRNGLTTAATVLTIGILLGTTVHAASDRRPTDICMPDCDTTDPAISVPEPSVELSWTAPTTRTDGELLSLSELEGFRIYYGTDKYDLIPLVDLDDSSITSHSISNLEPGLYFFSVTAYDYNGLESGLSEIVSKEIL